MRLLILFTAVFAALYVVAGTTGQPLSAAAKETFEPGTGKYILVLKRPPTDAVDPATGKSKGKEPDVAKHGGKVLHKKDLVRILKLPRGAAKLLRKEENVAYVQRVWMGEDRNAWDDDDRDTSLEAESLLETLETDLTWTTGQYGYDGSGNIKQIGADTYRYDSAGRLIEAVVKNTTERYRYDSFGNLLEKAIGGTPNTIAVSLSTNRMSAESYDDAGNVKTRAGVTSYTYDSVSMMDSHHKFPSTWRMIYGPDDERIGVVQESGLSRWKIRDFGGKVLREYRSDDIGMEGIWFWMKDYVHADGRVIGTERMNHFGGKRHFHTDHLGSVRMITDQSRYRISVHEYRPFGVEQTDATQEFNNFYDLENPSASAGDVAADAMKFTGHERDFRGWLNVDNDEYLDYMHARYYDPNLGRFLSVDPIPGEVRKPQSWNMYSYVQNNPLRYTDPAGLTLYANTGEAQKDICTLVGTNCSQYIAFDENGKVSVTATAADLKQNEALNLINDMVGSSKVYGAWVGTQMPSGNKILIFGDRAKNHQVVNLSTTARTDIPATANLPLPAGYDGAIGIFAGYPKIAVGADGKPVSRALLMFHELAENYHRTEKQQQYLASHQNGMQRETILRQQQPQLNQFTLGSGGPNIVTLKP